MPFEEEPGALHDIPRKKVVQVIVIQQRRVFQEAQELSEERQGWLLQGLGIPDIAVDDLPAGLLEFLGTLDDGAPDGVFGLQQALVEKQ
jgi:hypothetical protein